MRGGAVVAIARCPAALASARASGAACEHVDKPPLHAEHRARARLRLSAALSGLRRCRGRTGWIVCAACWDDLVIPSDPCCAACQRPFGERTERGGDLCGLPGYDPPVHDGIAAGTLYTETSRKLVLSYKHGRRIALAPLLARMISARSPPAAMGNRVIVPVPLTAGGYGSAASTRPDCSGENWRKEGHGTLCVDALVAQQADAEPWRVGDARPVHGRFRGRSASRMPRRSRVEGRDVMLVDDVLTSGATSTGLCQSAEARRRATRVTIACFARVLDEAIDSAASSSGPKRKRPGPFDPGRHVTNITGPASRHGCSPSMHLGSIPHRCGCAA